MTSTTNYHYQGTLEETSLAEMLYTIFRHKVPGVIDITHDGVLKRIYISNGNVLHASSTDRADRLGAHLYRQGKLSREDLKQTMQIKEQTGKRHGQVLIEQGLLAPGELFEAIRAQMESIVWSVFGWHQGEVSFKIGEFVDPAIKIYLPMRQVILRGIKRVPDTKSLVARLGKKSTVFKSDYSTEELIEIALNSDEYQLLRLVDGTRTLYDVCTEGPYSVSENARLLYAFHVLHLIRRLEDSSSGVVKIRLGTQEHSTSA
ncbi:MAG: DUF4388 domain-containing protein [Acidobacteriota bacterium]